MSAQLGRHKSGHGLTFYLLSLICSVHLCLALSYITTPKISQICHWNTWIMCRFILWVNNVTLKNPSLSWAQFNLCPQMTIYLHCTIILSMQTKGKSCHLNILKYENIQHQKTRTVLFPLVTSQVHSSRRIVLSKAVLHRAFFWKGNSLLWGST